jgi:hypothetical protein
MFPHVVPPSVERCHCGAPGWGNPEAAAVKVTCCPAFTVWSAGWEVMLGALLTNRTAALVVAAPNEFVNFARYHVLWSERVVDGIV